MTLHVNVIQKVTGGYTVTYNGKQATKSAKQTPSPAPKATRTQTVRKATRESKRMTPAEVKEIREVLAEACKTAGGSVGSVSLADYVKDHPEAGIPVKGDSISFIKLETQEYNGLIIPVPLDLLPAYVLVNQRGELMRMVSNDCKKITGDVLELAYAYRSLSRGNGLDEILGAVKKLKTWRNLSLKAKAEKEEINLADKKTADNSFRFFAEYFTDQLKGIEIKATSFFTIGGRFFPAQTMRDILKLLKNQLVTLTIKQNKTIKIVYNCDGLKGRSIIKAATIDSGIIPHFIPVV
jgi:hypothetical protein